MKKLDLSNQKFGNWTALRPGLKTSHWLCVCKCLVEKEVFIGSLRAGTSTQCLMCAVDPVKNGQKATHHGMYKSKEYRSWRSMRTRCLDPNHEQYPHYGGRGIIICQRWNYFENFIADMGLKPTPNHTIDRIDVNGNYCPENCKWSDVKEQNRNKTNTIYVIYNSVKLPLSQLCEELDLNYSLMNSRITRHGWTLEKAIKTPKQW